jgi:hypothetical protein
VNPWRYPSKCAYLAPDRVIAALLGVSGFYLFKAKSIVRMGWRATGLVVFLDLDFTWEASINDDLRQTEG